MRSSIAGVLLVMTTCVPLAWSAETSNEVTEQPPVRARALGLRLGQLEPGPLNAITDVPGVKVGQVTVMRGDGALQPGQGPVRTGVTVVVPREDVWHNKVPAGAFVLNGTGEMTGLAWVAESGFLEYPIALTNTLNVPRVANGVISWMLRRYPGIGITDDTLTPVVAECDDGRLNDIQGRHVSEADVMKALDDATSGPVSEGTVGADATHLAAVVHVDDSFGTDALEGANKGFSKANLKPVAVVKADRNKPDYPAIVPALAKATPQAILWFGSGTAVADGIKALRAAGSAAQVVTLSNNASAGFIKALGDASRGVIVTQVFPYEKSFSYGIEKEALELAKAKGQNEISPAILEGYAAAKVLIEALRRASPNPTRQKLLAALESLQKFDLGGLEISYSPDDHTGLDFADLSIIGSDGKFRR